jgi:hypothetical protein
MSDMPSVDERHPHRHVLEPTPYSTFCFGGGFALVMTASGPHACYTYKRWCYASESYWECQQVGLEDAEGG